MVEVLLFFVLTPLLQRFLLPALPSSEFCRRTAEVCLYESSEEGEVRESQII